MRHSARLCRVAVLVAIVSGCAGTRPPGGLGPAEAVAPGVEFYRVNDTALVDDAGPIAVFLLKLDPALVVLDSVLSNDQVVDAETVPGIASRHRAIAAVNGGYFNVQNGEPVSLLKVRGELVSDSPGVRGAVVIRNPADARTSVAFDQLSARVSANITAATGPQTLPIDGVDTTRERGKLMLYTPAYHDDTDTAPAGTEWVLDGTPLQVVEVRSGIGRTPIPRGGAVLSYGGTMPPPPLQALTVGTEVTFRTTWKSLRGLAVDLLESADHIVNGAGLLRRDGMVITDWHAENLNSERFVNARHPRTIVGVDGNGHIWLGAIDGRQSDHSIGMTFADLQRLCDRVGLRDALNLDGGGSTTMVVKDRVVNKPSDPAGPRAVSDAIVVRSR